MIQKITTGFVVQRFEDDGTFIDQDFVASDDVIYENETGTPIDPVDKAYFPFTMIQKLD